MAARQDWTAWSLARRLGATGYVYTVPADTFEPVDDHQWVSFVPIDPIAVETIQVDDYLHWVSYEREA